MIYILNLLVWFFYNPHLIK